MIGLVLVSHSARLAEGVKELADQMAQGRVPIVAAGGLEDGSIGTDAVRILTAIETVYQPDGVLVLMDLGSAVLSAEMAVEMLDPDRQPHVKLTSAALVEGAVAAATLAALGEPLDMVEAAARAALDTPKVGEPAAAPTPAEPSLAEAGREIVLTIPNKIGLHARPAALFVETAGQYQADIRVRNLSRPSSEVAGRSIFGVLGLNARLGHQIAVRATGPQADEALAAIRVLVDNGFGEELGAISQPAAPVPPTPSPPAVARPPDGAGLKGIPASPGVAIGPAFVLQQQALTADRRPADDGPAEWRRLEVALAQAGQQLEHLVQTTSASVGADEARIFDAHRQFLADPDLIERARARVFEQRQNAEWAIADVVDEMAGMLAASDDALIRERAADMRDVGLRVLRALRGDVAASPLASLSQPSVILAHDLTPSDTAQLDKSRVLAVATAIGGKTSHTAILAKALGIPAVVGLGDALLQIETGTPLIVDGQAGSLLVGPDETTVSEFQARRAAREKARAEALAQAHEPAVTRDGRRVNVWANVGDVETARQAVAMGAEGVGLFRTEVLFLERADAPSEAEQEAAYRAVAEALQGRPVTIRTLDIGGDKYVAYLDLPEEANPFLGQRAIRLCLARPDLFKTQLRAILRVAADHPVKIMFPMIATLDELRQAKAALAEARAELQAHGVRVPGHVDVGTMIEIPAAALTADLLAPEVDFFSLGTNDLVQYTFAVDRTNPAVDRLGDHLHPSILRQIELVVRAAHAQGKTVSVCGEMGSDEAAIPVLVGLGLDTLSVTPGAAPQTKQQVRGLSYRANRDAD